MKAAIADMCPESITGLHDEGSRRDGRCTWCGRKFTGKAQRPRFAGGAPTPLDEAYAYSWDPNWGSAR